MSEQSKQPADPTVQRGWRIDRIPGRPPRRVADGRYGLPLWLVRDGEHLADLELAMSAGAAERLHRELCYALPGEWDPSGVSGGHWVSPEWGRELVATIGGEARCPRLGWWIERVPDRGLRQLPEQRFGLPLRLRQDRQDVAALELGMSLAEAEQLHAALCRVLAEQTAPIDAPYCRLNAWQRARKQGLR